MVVSRRELLRTNRVGLLPETLESHPRLTCSSVPNAAECVRALPAIGLKPHGDFFMALPFTNEMTVLWGHLANEMREQRCLVF